MNLLKIVNKFKKHEYNPRNYISNSFIQFFYNFKTKYICRILKHMYV